jgi:hypothetical protein
VLHLPATAIPFLLRFHFMASFLQLWSWRVLAWPVRHERVAVEQRRREFHRSLRAQPGQFCSHVRTDVFQAWGQCVERFAHDLDELAACHAAPVFL